MIDDDDDVYEACCEDGCCEECEEAREAHLCDPYLLSVGLRLMIAAIEDDPDAVGLAIADIPDCEMCERSAWLSVLSALSHYGTPALAGALRQDLLHALDEVDADSEGRDGSEVTDD